MHLGSHMLFLRFGHLLRKKKNLKTADSTLEIRLFYADWSRSEPNGHPTHDEDCVMVSGWNAGHWMDEMCTRSSRTVCQILL